MKILFEKYMVLLEMKHFTEHDLITTYNGWEIYYNNQNPGRYKNHIERRLHGKDRKFINGNDMGWVHGSDFCTVDDFNDKIIKFVEELDNPGTYNIKAATTIKQALKKNANTPTNIIFDFKDPKSNKKVPVMAVISGVDKSIYIGSIFGIGIPYKKAGNYIAKIQLKEQYKILNN